MYNSQGHRQTHLPPIVTYYQNTPPDYFLCPITTFWARNGELLLIKYRPIIMVGLWCYNQSGVTELLIMRDPYHHDYGQMCFKSVKTLEALHSQLWKRSKPESTFFTAKNVEFLGLYPIRSVTLCGVVLTMRLFRYQPISHSVRFSLWDVYQYQSIWHSV